VGTIGTILYYGVLAFVWLGRVAAWLVRESHYLGVPAWVLAAALTVVAWRVGRGIAAPVGWLAGAAGAVVLLSTLVGR